MGKIQNPTHYDGHEAVIELFYPPTKLRGVISIHNSVRGPAAGGTRLWKYRTRNQMIADANDLARAMTNKCAIHKLRHGGGKAVFNRDQRQGLTCDELRWYADQLDGRFYTGEDIGFTVDYVNYMSQFTQYITGKSTELGGGGDPSLRTAEGLMHAIHACLEYKKWRHDTLDAYCFMIQGAGKVGLPLIENLLREHATVFFCDMNSQRAAFVQEKCRPYALRVKPSEIFEHEIDFFIPCGKGGTINRSAILDLANVGCQFIVPCANNALSNPLANARLIKRCRMLLAPDYVANGGGMINIASEMLPGGYNALWASEKTANIFDLTLHILREAEKTGTTTIEVADAIARTHLTKK